MTEELQKRKDIIFNILHELKKEFHDFILVGSSVFVLNNILLDREINDIDIVVKKHINSEVNKTINNIKIHILFKSRIDKEYEIIEGFKISTLKNAIIYKKFLNTEKHLKDLNKCPKE